jgi:hypothetical protein
VKFDREVQYKRIHTLRKKCYLYVINYKYGEKAATNFM